MKIMVIFLVTARKSSFFFPRRPPPLGEIPLLPGDGECCPSTAVWSFWVDFLGPCSGSLTAPFWAQAFFLPILQRNSVSPPTLHRAEMKACPARMRFLSPLFYSNTLLFSFFDTSPRQRIDPHSLRWNGRFPLFILKGLLTKEFDPPNCPHTRMGPPFSVSLSVGECSLSEKTSSPSVRFSITPSKDVFFQRWNSSPKGSFSARSLSFAQIHDQNLSLFLFLGKEAFLFPNLTGRCPLIR